LIIAVTSIALRRSPTASGDSSMTHPFLSCLTGSQLGRRNRPAQRRGFTLVELLVAATLTLLLTALVVQMFAFVSDGVFNSRANIELNDQLRNAKERLIRDLRGTTAPTVPPLDPLAGLGYFEYVEGPQVANSAGGDSGDPTSLFSDRDTVVGDLDDILMFTSFANGGEEFVGKAGSNLARSPVAEIAWYVKKGQLHRRIFLVNTLTTLGSNYSQADQSLRQEMGMYERTAVAPAPSNTTGNATMPGQAVPNSLGDLTMRERRSLHQPYVWPYEMMYLTNRDRKAEPTEMTATYIPPLSTDFNNNVQRWGNGKTIFMGLPDVSQNGPVLDKASAAAGPGGITLTSVAANTGPPSPFVAKLPGNTSREMDDVILVNVIGFDVKAWDPGAPLFRAISTDTSANTSQGLVIPGDPGYGFGTTTNNRTGALENFINQKYNGDSKFAPVGFGAYVDLNYMWVSGLSGIANEARQTSYLQSLLFGSNPFSAKLGYAKLPVPSFGFATRGRPLSGYPEVATSNILASPSVYDTWSRHYESDGIDNDGDDQIDEGTDGIDNAYKDIDGTNKSGNGFVDEPPVPIDLDVNGVITPDEIRAAEVSGERDAPPPWDAPLRGIKITIRVMEQDSKAVREVTVVHEFLPL
jgi:type II secretory pathway component PulJ